MTPFLTLVLAAMLARLGYQMARSPVLPRFAQDLEASPELIGLIFAASTITGIFVKFPAGALSDLFGRKRVLLLGCLFFAGPPFLYPLVTIPSHLLALRFLHGFATAIFAPVASAYVAELFQKERGERLGWFASATDAGATLGPLLGGFLLFYTASYPATYLCVGLLGIFPLLMIRRLPEEPILSLVSAGASRWEKFPSSHRRRYSASSSPSRRSSVSALPWSHRRPPPSSPTSSRQDTWVRRWGSSGRSGTPARRQVPSLLAS